MQISKTAFFLTFQLLTKRTFKWSLSRHVI